MRRGGFFIHSVNFHLILNELTDEIDCIDRRPYSLEQYRLIKPKEYIEISNIKPGQMRCLHTLNAIPFDML